MAPRCVNSRLQAKKIVERMKAVQSSLRSSEANEDKEVVRSSSQDSVKGRGPNKNPRDSVKGPGNSNSSAADLVKGSGKKNAEVDSVKGSGKKIAEVDSVTGPGNNNSSAADLVKGSGKKIVKGIGKKKIAEVDSVQGSGKKTKVGKDSLTTNQNSKKIKKAVGSLIGKKVKGKGMMQEQVDLSTGGIRLLKRARVTMCHIRRRVLLKQKLIVETNDLGVPVGPAATEMFSYIGVLARDTFPISTMDFRTISDDDKDKIWTAVNEAYVIPNKCREHVLASAATAWRDFKCDLTRKVIMCNLDDPDKWLEPPRDYGFINQDDWEAFVEQRLDPDFIAKSEAQQAKGRKNKYPCRLARKGYANFEQQLRQDQPDVDLDRSKLWVKARQDKDGNFKDPEVEEAARRIERLREEVAEGKIENAKPEDVLTLALGNPEHSGKVRAVSGKVKSSVYFNVPRQKRRTTEEILQGFIEEAQKKFEKQKSELDAAREEERRMFQATIERYEAMLSGKMQSSQSPKVPSPKEEQSGQGSCNREKPLSVAPIAVEDPAPCVKKLVLEAEQESAQNNNDDKLIDLTARKEYQLAKDSVDNIVAVGHIMDTGVESSTALIHGAPLGEDNVRVAVIRAIVGEALLPFPIKDEIITVTDAIGTCVAWPKELVISYEMSQPKKNTQQKQKRKRDCLEIGKGKKKPKPSFREVMPPNLPRPLQSLCEYASTEMNDGLMIHRRLDPKIFGKERYCAVGMEDIYDMANMENISNNSIAMYMSYLHEMVEDSETQGMFVFVNPIGSPRAVSLKRETETERTRTLSARLIDGKPGQLFLVPYNSGDHWELSVIRLDKGIVYHLDPAKRRLPVGEWRTIVDNAIIIYNAHVNNKSRKSVTWKGLSGIPPQKGRGCGLWVMLYMHDIVKDKNLEFVSKWEVRSGRKQQAYLQEEIDAVRIQWANHLIQIRDSQ